MQKMTLLKSFEEYKALYSESLSNNEKFWAEQARQQLVWHKDFSIVRHGSFTDGNLAWFLDGELNVSYNCVDRHALATPNKVAILHNGDNPDDVRKVTYNELLNEVCRVANYLKSEGLTKGDAVAIYMPTIPEAIFAMLACARLGVVHSVVFGGFSAEALASRVQDAGCKIIITADQGIRGGKPVHLKQIVDDALWSFPCPSVKRVLVFKNTSNSKVPFHPPRDVYWQDLMKLQRPYCPPVWVNSEDPLFLLYTSGSTGKPKGVMHTSAGYLLQVTMTLRYIFDYHPNDVHACVADIGWVTGHSYIVYGPLSNGACTVTFDSIPTFPDAGRYWDLVDRFKITQFYTSPTAIRALMKFGKDPLAKYSLSSLRVLGSVGEPINPEAWRWYNDEVGRGKCTIVDTYWQTETGAIMIAPIPGAIATKPGSASLPFFGVEPVIVDPTSGKILEGNGVTGVLAIARPWPSMARTILGDHDRFMLTYLQPYPGLYFTGDGAERDADGYYWIRGRVDDVINVSGHRLGTAEIESALVAHPSCAEAAVIGAPDDLTGQAIYCFCILRDGFKSDEDAEKNLKQSVRSHIGPFATPKHVFLVPNLPKTRSGKIIRRILRKIAAHEEDQLGDLTTLNDPAIVQVIIDMVKHRHRRHHHHHK